MPRALGKILAILLMCVGVNTCFMSFNAMSAPVLGTGVFFTLVGALLFNISVHLDDLRRQIRG